MLDGIVNALHYGPSALDLGLSWGLGTEDRERGAWGSLLIIVIIIIIVLGPLLLAFGKVVDGEVDILLEEHVFVDAEKRGKEGSIFLQSELGIIIIVIVIIIIIAYYSLVVLLILIVVVIVIVLIGRL